MFGALDRWDAIWYHWIAVRGYDPAVAHGNTAAFYPLWPLTWRVASIVPLPIYVVGALTSTALFAPALCLLYRMTLERYDVAMARRTTLYVAIWPLAFVYSLPYSESLYLLCSLAAFALTWHRRMWLGSAAGALAVLARPVGIALVPAFAWRIYRREGLRWRTGDWLGSTNAQHRGWGRGFVPLPIEIGRGLYEDVISNGLLRTLADVSFTFGWAFLWYRAWRVLRLPAEYLIYAALVVLLPSSGGSLLSMGRMGMVGFPLFWALADWGKDERVDSMVKTVAPALLATLVFLAFGTRTFVP
jgi:hypothetical protein